MALITIPRLPDATEEYDKHQMSQMIQTLEQMIFVLNKNYFTFNNSFFKAIEYRT